MLKFRELAAKKEDVRKSFCCTAALRQPTLSLPIPLKTNVTILGGACFVVITSGAFYFDMYI
jgi:hypothetical protein